MAWNDMRTAPRDGSTFRCLGKIDSTFTKLTEEEVFWNDELLCFQTYSGWVFLGAAWRTVGRRRK